mgnify:CR=1 FL=1
MTCVVVTSVIATKFNDMGLSICFKLHNPRHQEYVLTRLIIWMEPTFKVRKDYMEIIVWLSYYIWTSSDEDRAPYLVCQVFGGSKNARIRDALHIQSLAYSPNLNEDRG